MNVVIENVNRKHKIGVLDVNFLIVSFPYNAIQSIPRMELQGTDTNKKKSAKESRLRETQS